MRTAFFRRAFQYDISEFEKNKMIIPSLQLLCLVSGRVGRISQGRGIE